MLSLLYFLVILNFHYFGLSSNLAALYYPKRILLILREKDSRYPSNSPTAKLYVLPTPE
jgi:hypothetical protein